jgi:hypothetical protein
LCLDEPLAQVMTMNTHGRVRGDHQCPDRPRRARYRRGGDHSVRPIRKGLGWGLGVVTAAALTLVVTGAIPSLLGQIFNSASIKDRIRAGPDFIARADVYHPSQQGFSMVVPGDYHPDPNLVRALARPMAAASFPLIQQIRDVGGIKIHDMAIRVVVEGNRNQKVRILSIHPVEVRRAAPLDGVLFDILAQGQDSDIQMAFKMDQPSPQALKIDAIGRATREAFFDTNTISLAKGEQQVLLIRATAACYDVTFKLAIDYLVGNEQKAQIVSDHGRPFHVTAYRFDKSGAVAYREVFMIGGDFSIKPVGQGQIATIYHDAKQSSDSASCPSSSA